MLVDDFESKAATVCDAVRASGAAIRIPGEKSAAIAAQRLADDALPIPAAIWESIQQTAENGLKE